MTRAPSSGPYQRVNPVSEKVRDAAGVEILDLEYDVAGVGAVESSTAEENQAANFLVSYRLPENG